jgi:hypothetical protein
MPKKTIQLVDNDLGIINNNIVVIGGSNKIMQNIKTRLKTFLGEWFLDETIGLPYFQEIFVKGTSLSRIDTLFQQTILSTQGVIELRTYEGEYDNSNREYTVKWGVIVEGQDDVQEDSLIQSV